MIGVFTLFYLGGAYLGAREGLMFYQRFRRVVRRAQACDPELAVGPGDGIVMLAVASFPVSSLPRWLSRILGALTH